MSDDEQPSDPAQAGKELADPDTMTEDTQQQQTKAAQAISDFADLYPRQTGYCRYSVLSLANGEPTAYEVNVAHPDCECGDEQYNNDDGEICKHIAVALYQAPQSIEMERWVAKQVSDEMRAVQRKVESMEQTATSLESQLAGVDASSSAGTGAQQDSDGQQSDASGQSSDDGPDVQAEADKLQQAFDDVIDDMEVESNGGLIWFKTGYDTPDEWPFPGGSETFKVTSEPDMVKYVHDDSPDWADRPHPAVDDKPGEYFKNALDPQDVDGYISQVLE